MTRYIQILDAESDDGANASTKAWFDDNIGQAASGLGAGVPFDGNQTVNYIWNFGSTP